MNIIMRNLRRFCWRLGTLILEKQGFSLLDRFLKIIIMEEMTEKVTFTCGGQANFDKRLGFASMHCWLDSVLVVYNYCIDQHQPGQTIMFGNGELVLV